MRNKIVLDFDGIFASNMIYTQEGKWAKIFTWGIRHAVDMLVEHGFEVHIITGDSTEFGQNITKKFTSNIKIKSMTFCNSKNKLKILKKKFDLNEVIYSGDDIYDIEIFKNTYGITHGNTHESIAHNARYVSRYTPNDYYFTDLALHIITLNTNSLCKTDVADIIAKETSAEPMTDYLSDLRFKNIYILQQYSMRNHSDNTYNPLLDGNLNLTLHRLYQPLMSNPDLKVTITMPRNVNNEQLLTLITFIDKIFGDNRIKFTLMDYGINALENKKYFKNFTLDMSLYDLVISDFSNIEHFESWDNVIYNFNISKVEGLERNYIDSFFKEQANVILGNPEGFAYVLNQNQKDYFLQDPNIDCRMEYNASIVVDTKIINLNLLKEQKEFYKDKETFKILATPLDNLIKNYDLALFFPFRLSDPCYNFEGLIEYLSTIDKKIIIIVTDPNDSLSEFKPINNVDVYNVRNAYKELNTKSLYFGLLYYLNNRNNVYIPIFEDPTQVLHQTILEIYKLTTEFWDTVVFLDKNDFNYETLTNHNNRNHIKEELKKLYY